MSGQFCISPSMYNSVSDNELELDNNLLSPLIKRKTDKHGLMTSDALVTVKGMMDKYHGFLVATK